MKHLKKFEGYSDDYGMENFTWSDMEFVKDLYEEGMTDPAQIAREIDWKEMSSQTVEQIISALKSSGEINENVASGLEKETILHILKLKVEEELDKIKDRYKPEFGKLGVDRRGFEGGELTGRQEAYENILNWISDFEKK